MAKLFGKTEGQILRDRATLRKILKIKKLKDIHQAWLLANQEVLQDSSLKKEEIAQKLGIEPKQVYRKKGQLRKLLNQPHYNDLVQAWRLDNQDILLSLHLTISEIAQLLDRNERYIVKNRMILRKFLGITKQDQKRTWVLNHSQDLETLSIEELQQKYNLRHSIAKTYKRLLIELKQNENE
ncbi:hypothetical protein [Acinetobacter indicus]|uniref:Uncharacterized protein n=1 Tax=Acinetobacter indicus TaxID=756892 RepID=A0AAW8Z6F4_9GAMM|nr:hypothetical protein [Acinetobacter indicus]MDV4316597.1 hypothetical protein [Acinetobacter indicus]